MTDPRLEVKATPRAVPPDQDTARALFSLAWQATQKWSEEIRRLKASRQTAIENENKAWIALADECFRLQKAYTALTPAMEQCSLSQGAQYLALVVRNLEQTLRLHDVEIETPAGAVYSTETSEVLESVGQTPQAGIEEPVIQQVLVPIVKRGGQVIRLGKAIIAVPEQL